MIGSRTRLALLTSFFVFSFALLFLALVQNYAHAGNTSLTPVRLIAFARTAEIQSPVHHDIVPSFGVEQSKHPETNFDDDSSFQKYLDPEHPFADPSYTPIDLITIDSHFTANNSQAFQLRQEASLAFADMAWHFRDAFSGDRLYISSAYRSFGLQDFLIKQGCKLIKCAQRGTSEHQAGLAVDVKVITKGGKAYSLDFNGRPNKYYDWLKSHAAGFGFHNTYQKGIEIDGKIAEGWHRRYVGVELATLLAEKGETFAEYYNTVKK